MKQRYRYTECGLDNVVLENIDVVTDHAGEETVCIPAINKLHDLIATCILRRHSRMSGKELRFLRTRMGMTQGQLAELLHRDAQTIARWEKGESEIDGNAETLFRLLAAENLGISLNADVQTVSRWSVPSDGPQEIVLLAEGDGYRPRAA